MNAMTLRITYISQSKKRCQTRTRLLPNLPEIKQKILQDFVRPKMHKTLLVVFRGAITAWQPQPLINQSSINRLEIDILRGK